MKLLRWKISNKEPLLVLVISVSLIQLSCSFLPKKELSLKTDPSEAKVFMRSSTGEVSELGSSPIDLKDDHALFDNDFVHLVISKQGFRSRDIYLDTTGIAKKVIISVELESAIDWSGAWLDGKATPVLSHISTLTAEIQSAIMNRRLEEADHLTNELIEKYPKVPIGYTLRGNMLIISGQQAKALEYYRKALQVDPNHKPAQEIIDRIGRSPSGGIGQ